MKNNNFFKFWMMVLSLVIIMSSCNDSSDEVLDEIPSDFSQDERSFLFSSNAVRSKARTSGIGGPAGAIFRLGGGFTNNGRASKTKNTSPIMSMRALMKNQSGTTFGRSENDGDTTALPDCFTESFNENEDGTYEYIIDFGEGCDFFGETFKGKVIERGSYNEDAFEASTTYDNFGTDFWEINGSYRYEGTWEISTDDQDTLEFDWFADYNYDFDLVETYSDDDETFTVTSTGNGRENSDQDGYTVLEQQNEFTYNTGESYTSKVDVPLFLSYGCDDDIFIFIKGEESGTYTIEGESATYVINYGDGECDNIITITEDGEETVIDLDEEYDDLGDD